MAMKLVVKHTFIDVEHRSSLLPDDFNDDRVGCATWPGWRRRGRSCSDGVLKYCDNDDCSDDEITDVPSRVHSHLSVADFEVSHAPSCSSSFSNGQMSRVHSHLSVTDLDALSSDCAESTEYETYCSRSGYATRDVDAPLSPVFEVAMPPANQPAPPTIFYVPVLVPGSSVNNICAQQQAAKVIELDAQAAQLKAQSQQMEEAARQIVKQAEEARAMIFDSQAAQLKAQAEEAREAARQVRIQARSCGNSTSGDECFSLTTLPQQMGAAPAMPPGNWSCCPVQEAGCQGSLQGCSSTAGQFTVLSSSQPRTVTVPDMPPGHFTVSSGTHHRTVETVGPPPGQFNTTADTTQEFTTVMLRNCPNDLTRKGLLQILDEEGLGGLYDFVYLPVDFLRDAGLGYAFVNFTSHQNAVKAMDTIEGFRKWPIKSHKVCAVSWGHPLQGLTQHIERYKNSPVMHDAVPDKYKPILFKDGIRQPFPPPTKRIRGPRMKRNADLTFADASAGEHH